MDEILPDCEACTKGVGKHKFGTKQHGAMPQGWKKKDTKKKLREIKKNLKSKWTKVSPYAESGLPLFSLEKEKQNGKKENEKDRGDSEEQS